jgi:hypothetical protein
MEVEGKQGPLSSLGCHKYVPGVWRNFGSILEKGLEKVVTKDFGGKISTIVLEYNRSVRKNRVEKTELWSRP